MKRWVLFFIFLIFFSSCLEAKEKRAGEGDLIELDYIGRLEDGSVFDTTLSSIAADELIKKAPFFVHRKKYEPFKFRINNSEVVKGFEKNIIGMKEGEEKEFWIEPAEAYGEWKSELTKTYPRTAVFEVYEEVSMSALNLNPDEIKVGATFPWRYWKAKIVEVYPEDKIVIIENLAKNSTVNLEFGVLSITAAENKIIARMDPTLNAEIKTRFGVGRITNINETDFVVDFNHPLAGKKLKFYVRVKSITKEGSL